MCVCVYTCTCMHTCTCASMLHMRMCRGYSCVDMCVCEHTCLCACVHRPEKDNKTQVSFCITSHYSLETESLTEPGARGTVRLVGCLVVLLVGWIFFPS